MKREHKSKRKLVINISVTFAFLIILAVGAQVYIKVNPTEYGTEYTIIASLGGEGVTESNNEAVSDTDGGS